MTNALYYGDNLDILRKLVANNIQVDLCYIDPPFNSKSNYNQIYSTSDKTDQAQAQAFVDTWEWDTTAQRGFNEITESGGFSEDTIELFRGFKSILRNELNTLAYLVSITLRATEIHRLLKPTGSFFLHCDPTASHYLKLVLDSIFGTSQFRNEITWKRADTVKGNFGQGATFFDRNTDSILFYAKSQNRFFHQFKPYTKEYIDGFYKYKEPDGRIYRLISMTGPGGSAKGNPEYDVMGVRRFWRYSRERMNDLISTGMVVQTKSGAVPQRKLYLDQGKGVPVQSLWDDIPALHSQSSERLGYPTQKPEALLERIIKACTEEGDLILDAYCGCGTTVAVAERLHRRWIGIDITFQSIALILKRMEDTFDKSILDTIYTDGIPQDLAAAQALANRRDDKTRKEFEKWAVLTYSRNRAVIREKKGADKGIDGVAYYVSGHNETEKMVFQVKSGDVKRNDIATLKGDMEREGAKLATLITLREPTQPMKEEAAQAGVYHHPLMGLTMNRVQIVTIREIIEDKRRLELPMTTDVLKTAPKAVKKSQATLDGLFGDEN
jgi:adenine specific DNA methylase Mod